MEVLTQTKRESMLLFIYSFVCLLSDLPPGDRLRPNARFVSSSDWSIACYGFTTINEKSFYMNLCFVFTIT